MDIFDRCCALVVMKNHKILLGERRDGQGWSMAGGKLEENENFENAAKRELKEEFGINANSIETLGVITSEAYVGGEKKTVRPKVYLCRDFHGTPTPCLSEMKALRWVEWEEIYSLDLFPPTKKIIEQFGSMILY